MSEKETALVTIEPTTALAVFTNAEKVDPILAAIKKIVAEFTPDVTTAKGRAEIASIAHKVARSKTYLDGIGKDLVAEYKAIPQKIDANRKRIRDELGALKDEVRKPLTEWEQAEASRVQGIKDRIGKINTCLHYKFENSDAVRKTKLEIEDIAIDESFAEFTVEAAQSRDAVLAYLRDELMKSIEREAEAAELKRLREEAAKREAEDRDRRIAEESAAKAKAEAERIAEAARVEAERKAKAEREAAAIRELEAKLAAERAEREKRDAIEKAERDAKAAIEAERKRADDAEKERQAEVARANAEAGRRAADLANRERVHDEIMSAFASEGIPQQYAATVVSMLSTGSIPHVSVKY